MRSLVFAGAVALALSACASGQSVLPTAFQAYHDAEAVAAAYMGSPTADPAVVAKIKAVEAKVDPVVAAAEAAGSDPSSEVKAAIAAAVAELLADVMPH